MGKWIRIIKAMLLLGKKVELKQVEEPNVKTTIYAINSNGELRPTCDNVFRSIEFYKKIKQPK